MFKIAIMLFLLLPFIIWCGNGRLWKRKLPSVVLFALTVLVCSAVYVMAIRCIDYALESELYRYDLNGDREFSEFEQTLEMKAAMTAWANDTGRSMAPLVAVPASVVWSTFTFVVCIICNLIFRSFDKKKYLNKRIHSIAGSARSE